MTTQGRPASPPPPVPPKPWIIVADDLTGATDAAAPFAARGLRTAILLAPRQPQPRGFDVLALSTNSRALTATAAAATLRQLCARLRHADQNILYKKFDSTLKGNIAAELRTVLAHGGFDHAVFCPANPLQGRRVRAGILHVTGLPTQAVATVFAGKPLPVTCPDATTESHLRTLVLKCWANNPRTLLAGSAGLARHLAAALTGGRARLHSQTTHPDRQSHTDNPPDPPRRVVIVAGSLNPVTLGQLGRLPRHKSIEHIDLPIHRVSTSSLQRRLRQLRNTLVQRPPHALVLTGGDTALAVCRVLHIRSLELFGELVPGIALTRTLDGVLPGLWIATKPGGFGTPTTLRSGVRRLQQLDTVKDAA